MARSPGELDVVDVVRADAVAGPGEPPDLGPAQVAVLDRVEGQVELGDHAPLPERRQHLAQPRLRSVVEREDHRPLGQPRPGVPVRGQVPRQDRRVAVRPEPVELGLEGGRQRVVGKERPPALCPPVPELGRDGLHAVVVDDGDAASGDAHRRRRREGVATDRRGEPAVRGGTRWPRAASASARASAAKASDRARGPEPRVPPERIGRHGGEAGRRGARRPSGEPGRGAVTGGSPPTGPRSARSR